VSKPWSWWNGPLAGSVVLICAPTASHLPFGENFSSSGPLGTLTVPTVRGGLAARSIRLTVSTSPLRRPMLDTAASVPAAFV
jgi:hypothetical protein